MSLIRKFLSRNGALSVLALGAALGAIAYVASGPAPAPSADRGARGLETSASRAPSTAVPAPTLAGRVSPAAPAAGNVPGAVAGPEIQGADEEIPVYRGAGSDLPLDTDHPEVRRAMAVQERHTDDLLENPGVVGTAVGLNRAGDLAVVVMTRRSDVAGIPTSLDGMPVVVRETGDVVAHEEEAEAYGAHGGTSTAPAPVDTTARFDAPVPIGVSTGHPTITAGTIGCRLKDSSGDTFALSNNHVFAAENTASFGDDVLQPGAYDGGIAPGDAVGVLYDYEPLVFTTSASNTIDAAIALTLSSRGLGRSTPSGGYGTPRSATKSAAIGLAVMKYGRTTHQTTAKVGALNASVLVDYGPAGVARFVGQISVYGGNFSAGGDSGSLIVGQKGGDARKPVGLLFAGGSSTTFANPIGLVLTRFGVTVDGD